MNKNINLIMNIEDLRKKYWLLKMIVVNEKETWLWYNDKIHLYWSSFHILWCIIDYYWFKLCFDIISIKFVLEKNYFDNDNRNFWFYNDYLLLKVRMISCFPLENNIMKHKFLHFKLKIFTQNWFISFIWLFIFFLNNFETFLLII